MAKETYTAKSIDVELGLDGVRKTPQVYIGPPNANGMFTCFREIPDNSIDEAQAGHGSIINIIIDENVIWITDDGRGIPVEKHHKTKISTFETVLSMLNAGAKGRHGSDDASYKKSRGTHGMGVALTNAMSSDFQAWTFRKKWYHVAFKKGKTVKKVTESTRPKLPLKVKKKDVGTVIKFEFDTTVFEKGSVLDINIVKEYLKLSAYMYPTVKFVYTDKAGSITYHQPKGLTALVKRMIESHDDIETIGKPFTLDSENVKIIFQYSTFEDEELSSFVNGLQSIDGGTHVQGFYKALTEALQPFKKKKDDFRSEDARSGIFGIININISTPLFTGQTKDKLATPAALDMVYKESLPALKAFFTKNKSIARKIITRAVEIRGLTEKFKASKKAAASLKSTKNGKTNLPDKFAGSQTKNPKERELFVCEGESAYGTAKQARDPYYQEALPLTGKPLNVYKDKKLRLYENKVIMDIFKAIGYDPSVKDPMSRIRVGKIILLTDADPDGGHIDILLLGLFNKQIPELFEAGMIYTVNANLYMYKTGNKKYMGKSLNDLEKQVGKGFNPQNVTRIKGWGELSPRDLKEIAFDPTSRSFTRILPAKTAAERKEFIGIVGESPLERKKLLGVE